MGSPQKDPMFHIDVQHKQKRPTQSSNVVNIKIILNT